MKVWRLAYFNNSELHRGVPVIRDYSRHWSEEFHLCLVENGGGELYYRGSCMSHTDSMPFYRSPGRGSFQSRR